MENTSISADDIFRAKLVVEAAATRGVFNQEEFNLAVELVQKINNLLNLNKKEDKMLHGVEAFVNHNIQVFGEEGPKVILDVGTRDLNESIEILSFFPNAKLIAFEPNPSQYQFCLERAKAYPNITVLDCAVSDVEGEVDFYVVGANYGGSSLLEPIDVPYSDGTHTKVAVQCRRLDSVLAELGIEKVDAIWMDVQGNELKALKGLGKYIETVDIMHTEACPNPYYIGHQSKSELEQFVADCGFSHRFEVHVGHPYGEGDLICEKIKGN